MNDFYSLVAEPLATGFVGAFNDALFVSQSAIGACVWGPFLW